MQCLFPLAQNFRILSLYIKAYISVLFADSSVYEGNLICILAIIQKGNGHLQQRPRVFEAYFLSPSMSIGLLLQLLKKYLGNIFTSLQKREKFVLYNSEGSMLSKIKNILQTQNAGHWIMWLQPQVKTLKLPDMQPEPKTKILNSIYEALQSMRHCSLGISRHTY